MLNIHISTLAHMEKKALKDLLNSIGMDQLFFARKLRTKIWELEMLIGEASSIPGDAYTKTRANISCQLFHDEICMCKEILGKLDIQEKNGPTPFTKADIKRLAREAKLAREAEDKTLLGDYPR